MHFNANKLIFFMAVAELTLQTFLPKPLLSTKMAPAHQHWGLPIIVEKKLT